MWPGNEKLSLHIRLKNGFQFQRSPHSKDLILMHMGMEKNRTKKTRHVEPLHALPDDT